MLNLIKHLKPFIWSIVIIFGLLFGQAMADLALPGYMSDIVNVGIQNGGIENTVPKAISAAEYQKVTLFIPSEDKTLVADNYQLLDKSALSAADYATDLKTYPALAKENIYVLNTNNKDAINQMNSIFGLPIMIVYGIETKGASAFPGLSQIPQGADPFQAIAQVPQDQLDQLLTKATSSLKSLTSSTVLASDSVYIKDQYTALGMNMTSIQTMYILRIGGIMLLITLASVSCAVATGFLSARVSAGLSRNLRQQIFTRVEGFSNTEFDKFSTASLITRSTNDITQIQMLLVMLFRIIFYAPILGIGGIIKVIGTEVSMTWIIAVAVVGILSLIGVMLIIALPKFKTVQKLVDKLNLVMRQILSGLMVIRAFNTQKQEEDKFDIANKDLTKISSLPQPHHGIIAADNDAHHEHCDDSHRLGRRAPGECRYRPGRRSDGLYAIRHADYHVFLPGLDGVRHDAARAGLLAAY